MNADDMVELTREMLNAGRGAGGDYTAAQLRLLGVDSPPPRGWRSGLVGRKYRAADLDAFIELRDSGQKELF